MKTLLQIDDDEKIRRGAELADVLHLRRDPKHKDRWLTTWGNKTDLGLYLTVLRIIEGELPPLGD